MKFANFFVTAFMQNTFFRKTLSLKISRIFKGTTVMKSFSLNMQVVDLQETAAFLKTLANIFRAVKFCIYKNIFFIQHLWWLLLKLN